MTKRNVLEKVFAIFVQKIKNSNVLGVKGVAEILFRPLKKPKSALINVTVSQDSSEVKKINVSNYQPAS
jgi:hypothetical protein